MYEQAKQLVSTLQDAGYEAYFVGGCVRDELMDIVPKDYDIVTTASTVEMLILFHDHKVLDVGAAFGVLKVVIDDIEYDLATARTDGEYSDSRRPDSINPATIKEDIMRRDFTMNGLLFDPVTGKLIDYVDGAHDISEGIIRTIGDPYERFTEDPLRMLRAVRFSCSFDMDIEEDTREAIHDEVDSIFTVSPERIKMEMDKILMSKWVENGLWTLQNTGLLFEISPIIDLISQCEQNPEFHPEGNVLIHTIRAIGESVPDLTIRYALLLHDVGKMDTHTVEDGVIRHKGHEKESVFYAETFTNIYNFDNKTKADIMWLVGQHMRVRKMDEMGIYKQWELYAHPLFEKLVQMAYADTMSTGRIEEAHDFRYDKLTYVRSIRDSEKYKQMQKFTMINGNDCLKVGIKGEDIGKCLKILKRFYIEDRYTTRKELLEHLSIHKDNYKEKK